MYKVMKRDGTIAEFDIAKISKAITKAFEAEKCEVPPTVLDLLALKVTSDFSPKIKDGIINVEDIQDSVERVLSQAGYTDVAKAYILYRKQREKVRNVKATMLNYKAARLPPTTGSAKSTMRKLPTRTAARPSTCTTCPC